MFFANDQSGNKVHIDQTQRGSEYFCPCCNEKLILRKGKIRAHCFSHPKSSTCTDHWHYDMSDWHKNWQNRFPQEAQEVVKEFGGKRHRADVLLENEKCVLEFQHSKISNAEFNERNAFYKSLGYRVKWIFDVRGEEIEPNTFYDYTTGKTRRKKDQYRWKKPRDPFKEMELDFVNQNVEIYFQYTVPAAENEELRKMEEDRRNNYDIDDFFSPEKEAYYDDHKNDRGLICKVIWMKQGKNGIFYFVSERTDDVYVDDFVKRICKTYC